MGSRRELLQDWAPTSDVTLGPLALREGVLTLRSPRFADGPAWSAARRANRTWLERAFPAWGGDWYAEQSPAAWVARVRQLRRAAREQGARSFVVYLDDRLTGEIGIDAVDATSGTGEGSVWLVRDHGSADVMNAASLLIIEHVFAEPGPMDGLLSPTATVAREGRAPGLSAVGFAIAATVPRPIGRGPAVDHDMWLLPNTAANRDRTAALLRGMRKRPATLPARSRGPQAGVAAAVAEAAARAARAARRRPVRAAPLMVQNATVRSDAAGVVWSGERRVGRVTVDADRGTAALTVDASVDDAADRSLLTDLVARLVDAAPDWAPWALSLDVRVPLDGTATTSSHAPDPEALAALGLRRTAIYPGNPEGPRRWRGEQRWTADLTTHP